MIVGSTLITGKLQLEASPFTYSLSPLHNGKFVQTFTINSNYTRKLKLISVCDLTYHRKAKLEGTPVNNLVQPQANVNYELDPAGDI